MASNVDGVVLADDYPGWIFRLNIPKSNINNIGAIGVGNTDNKTETKKGKEHSSSQSEEEECGNLEGVQLLPKKLDPSCYGHSNEPEASAQVEKEGRAHINGQKLPANNRYLAELCPHGVYVASVKDYSDNTNNDGLGKERDFQKQSTSTPNPKKQKQNQQGSTWSWSYSSQSSYSQWNVTSSKLLSVAYRPAHEAYPSYTNISRKREYWHRSVGACLEKGGNACGTECSKCGICCNCSRSEWPTSRNMKRRWKNMKRRITGAPKPIHRVRVDYTVDDVLFMEPIISSATSELEDSYDSECKGIWIRGIGYCNALRIYLRPKFGSFPNNRSTANSHSQTVDTNADIDLPSLETWDNLPRPPWACDNQKDSNHSEATKQWGPVITFAIPCECSSSLSDKQRKTNDTQNSLIHVCPPLLWKVDHPPNAHVAIDSFSLMEGALHLHQRRELNKTKFASGNRGGRLSLDCDQKERLMPNNGEADNNSMVSSSSSSSSASYDYDIPTNVYINGYQSWSYSGSVVRGEEQPKSAMPSVLSEAFNRGGVVLSSPCNSGKGHEEDVWHENLESISSDLIYNAVSPNRSNAIDDNELNERTAFYKSDMFACISSNGATSTHYNDERVLLDEEGGPALIIGFLSQRHQFGTILMDRNLCRFNLYACLEGVVTAQSASSSSSFNGVTTDWAYCQIVDSSCYDEESLVYYVHAAGDHNGAQPMEKGLTTGWCSWYHYYSDIDHDSLSRNADILKQSQNTIGFNVCLIDDGYMTKWGDWTSLKPEKFVGEGGMRVLSDAIRSKGMKPGVWLAPFACDKSSDLAKEHPDWIIRNDYGRRANSSNCGKFFYGLDATNPAVRKHVYTTIRRAVEEWNFDVLKLDFLYACCLAGNGKFDASMSRAEAMHLGLRTIRAAAGKDTFIIGCGCPVGSAIGFVDGMRVSCDTGPTWYPEFPLPWWDHGTLPALRGMLRNTMSRAPLGHRWWHNDPDCILLGESTKLTDNEVQSAASIVAMTGGMFLLSDDMEKVSNKRLRIAKQIFPLTGVTAVPLDLHSTINSGMPSVLRLWCSEKSEESTITDESRQTNMKQSSKLDYSLGYYSNNILDPYSRDRSCFVVADGLGTWTIVSFSNWLDHEAKLSVSFSALVGHSCHDFESLTSAKNRSSTPRETLECGYHIFSFWSSKYSWIPHQTLVDNDPLIKKLEPHQTEIFHIKPANPTRPQYIGSDLHFSCGFEVHSFDFSSSQVTIQLKNQYAKQGSVFVYLPDKGSSDKVEVKVNGNISNAEVVARPCMGLHQNRTADQTGRVFRVGVSIDASGARDDGKISFSW